MRVLYKSQLEFLLERCNDLLYMINRFVAGEAFNNIAIGAAIQNVRIYLDDLRDTIN